MLTIAFAGGRGAVPLVHIERFGGCTVWDVLLGDEWLFSSRYFLDTELS